MRVFSEEFGSEGPHKHPLPMERHAVGISVHKPLTVNHGERKLPLVFSINDLAPIVDDVVRYLVNVERNDAHSRSVARPKAYFPKRYPNITRKHVRLGTIGMVQYSRGR